MTAATSSSPSGQSPEELSLAGDFPRATREQWRELVAGVLRKAGHEIDDASAPAVEDLLATDTDDGFRIRPLYAAEDAPGAPTGVPGLPPFVRGPRPEGRVAEGWLVRQRHVLVGEERADDFGVDDDRRALLADLEGGVSSPWLVLEDGGDGGGSPVDVLQDVLADVFVDLAPVALDAGRDTPAAARELLRIAADKGVAGADLSGSLGFDPLLARTRGGPALDDEYTDALVELARTAAEHHPDLRTVVADGLPFHEAGGSDGQELGATLAAGVAALRTLTGGREEGGAGLPVDDAFARVELRLAATADQFATVAKLRAARRCWARIGEECGASDRVRGAEIHAVTSPAMMTTRDPWVNMLRTTIACVAAGLGGADAVTVLPFDAALGMPDDFARRVARNTQALLLEESHLAHVIDPAGGSWYVESLTDALARAAWDVFTGIERDGGITAVLDAGSLAERLAATWANRRDRIAHRRDPITGVSEFPNLAEELPERPPWRTSRAFSTRGRVGREGGLPRVRYAEVFEQLRDRADAAEGRPQVFLATIGELAQYTARASFAGNLFNAGGIETVDGPGGTDASEIAAAFSRSGTPVAVLASSDTVYGEHAAAVAAALREAGATRVLLAGKNQGEADVDDVLYQGSDAAGLLADTLDHLDVARREGSS